MTNLEVALLLRARDQASPELNKVAQTAKRSAEQTSRAAVAAQSQAQRAVRETTTAVARAATEQTRLHQRTAQAREQLGIRSENTIRREIQQTEAAYNRLSRSGTMSAQAQAQAYQAMTAKVKTLRAEMGQVEQQQRSMAQRARSAGSTALAVGAGVAAGAYAASKPVGETMAYDRRLAMMANTAFSERDAAGRRAGTAELHTAITSAIRAGGGTKDEAANTLDSLLASGAMSQKSAMNLLPTLQKYATASDADPNALGNIAIRAMQTFGIKESELPKALDMAITAGQAGGFELKDMARWLPQQMAAAKTVGMSGMGDFGKLLAANQAAVITAGTKDEAGNNLVNLLAKINSQDTAQDAKKLGINLAGTLAKARGEGKSGLDAFIGIADHVVGKDKRFTALRAQAESAKGAERQAALSGMTDILEGSAIGKLVQDRQALMALVGVMGNRKYLGDIEKKLSKAQGAGDTSYQTIASTNDFKVKQAANEADLAKQSAFTGVNNQVGGAASWFTDFAREHPTLAGYFSGTVETGKTVGAAGAGALLMRLVQGGGATGGPSLWARAGNATQGLWTRGAAAMEGGALTRLGLGAAPLAAMAGVTQWAGDTSNDKGRTDTLKGMSDWLGQWFGKQAEFDARRNAQLEALGRKLEEPIKVEVTVVNGNVVASVNKVNQIMSGRF